MAMLDCIRDRQEQGPCFGSAGFGPKDELGDLVDPERASIRSIKKHGTEAEQKWQGASQES
ncbi:hypothetical protein GCM10011320_05730 [Neoroseomonas lacus]|uniref:Uncharacterized protein n=1 Tax=Neoroseomonas lacus TaxID=287609 RepID=A0A917NHT4_9PROT|nr:hypothetical protein GCM10011320_05730 [Neoroseomonas lacus]